MSMKKNLSYTVLSVVTIASLICCSYLYIEYKDCHNSISNLRKQNDLMAKQLESRNKIIDKALGLNIDNPLLLSKNFEQVKKEYWGSQQKGVNIITDDMSAEIILPLYTPDGHYFGEISYAAYSAILNDKLEYYESLNNEELQILHSYMNYITLNPGMSLIKSN